MDIAAVFRDWVVPGVVLYIAVRYGFLRDQERASLNAEIGRLKGMVSPVITAEHKFMREYAEEVTRNRQELLQRLKELEGGRVEPRNMENKIERANLQGRAEGLLEYSQAIDTLMDEALSVLKSGTGSWPATNIKLVEKILMRDRELLDVVRNATKRLKELRTLDEK